MDGKDEADRWGRAAASDGNGVRGLSGEGELGCGRMGCGSAGLLAVLGRGMGEVRAVLGWGFSSFLFLSFSISFFFFKLTQI